MKPTTKTTDAFTIIELLVVIAIIAILAGLLMPAVTIARRKAQVAVAKVDMKNLAVAISQYEQEYNRLPDPGNPPGDYNLGREWPALNPPTDITIGLGVNGADAECRSIARNSGLMLILVNEPKGSNYEYAKNPQRKKFFEPKQTTGTTESGLSISDYQYRDPWGNPYVITLDLNYDGKCYDWVYKRPQLHLNPTNGFFGLQRENPNQGFYFSGQFMIWSVGPDGSYDISKPANQDPNKDNVIGWQ